MCIQTSSFKRTYVIVVCYRPDPVETQMDKKLNFVEAYSSDECSPSPEGLSLIPQDPNSLIPILLKSG